MKGARGRERGEGGEGEGEGEVVGGKGGMVGARRKPAFTRAGYFRCGRHVHQK